MEIACMSRMWGWDTDQGILSSSRKIIPLFKMLKSGQLPRFAGESSGRTSSVSAFP
jgi:hypothetical protein